MRIRQAKTAAFVAGAALVTAVLAYFLTVRSPFFHTAAVRAETPAERSGASSGASEDERPEFQVRLTTAERQALGIQTAPAQYNKRPEQVRMSATTALDPDSLAHVHARFAGEVTEVKVELGRQVKKGQPLAAVWSKDLGEKKSELIDALSQLKLNEEVLKSLQPAYQKGAIPERTYRQAIRDVDASRIAYERAYRTLLSWRLSKEEVERIEHEDAADWPRETVRAPIDGVVVEKNVVPGELMDTSTNLFVIGDLARIAVWAYAYEEDLVKLRAGEPWTVTVKARPGKTIEGKIRVVGAVVDPTQHTAVVQGIISNPGGVLRAGMFATATVALPPDPSLVVVPTSALIDAEDHTFVYVQSGLQAEEFIRREVGIKKRQSSETFLTAGVRPGELVVSRGALELDQKAHAAPTAAHY